MAHRKWWKLLVLIGGMGGVCVVMQRLGFEWSSLTPQRVRAYILSFGGWSQLVYVLIFSQPVFPLPASVMLMASGLSFGVIGGVGTSLVAATLRGCGQFMLARVLGREALEALLRGRFAALDQRIGRSGFWAVFWFRLTALIPFDLQNFSLGFSSVSFTPYVLATVLGLFPGVVLWVYLGHALTDTRQVVWKVATALLIIAVLWCVQRRVRISQARMSS